MKLTVLALCLLTSVYSTNQKKIENVNIDDFITETQISLGGTDSIDIGWWIPLEFWLISLQEQGLPQESLDEMIATLSPYTIFAVVSAEVGPFGGATFANKALVDSSVKMIDPETDKELSPLTESALPADLQMMLNMMQPMLKSIMGELGENMHFYVFNDLDASSERIADPYTEGLVQFKSNDMAYDFKTPISALIEEKICPNDGAEMNGTWKYCPNCGSKLVNK